MTAAAPEPCDEAAGPRSGDDAPGTGGAGEIDRAATVAGLAAAIARIGSDGGRPAPARRDAMAASRPRRGQSGSGSRAGSGARNDPPPDDPAGSSGDAPGDPESIARTICLRLLTDRARSRSELADALRRRGIPPEVATPVLERFTEVGLIDDAAYARAFVASKHRDRGLGRAALRTELRRKGIDEAAADRALETIDGEAERRRATELVAKKLDSAMFAGLPAARRRLLGLLARRGYSASLAASVVGEALRGFVEPAPLDVGDESVAAGWDDPPE